MQDRESSLLAKPELQFVCLREVATRSFPEAVASQVRRTALRHVRLQRQRGFRLLLHTRHQMSAMIHTNDQNFARQGASLQSGVSVCEQIDAELKQLLAALLQ